MLELFCQSHAPGDPTISSAAQSGVLPLVSLSFPSSVSDVDLDVCPSQVAMRMCTSFRSAEA